MKPAVTDPDRRGASLPADPFPPDIRVVRARRRTIELTLHDGTLVAHVPRRISARELQQALPSLRVALWRQLQRQSVFDDVTLQQRAQQVAVTHLSDQRLPAFAARFSSRQQKRWGSCTVTKERHGSVRGSIRISTRLRGHPAWVVDHLLLHELAHLVVIDHGPRFQELMRRSPHYERAEGYLEALVHLEQVGEHACLELEPAPTRVQPLPLFEGLEMEEAATFATASPSLMVPKLRARARRS